MNARDLRNALILITVTAVVTLGIQVYRSMQIYEQNKQRYINEVRGSFDKAIETYYSERAKNDVFRIFSADSLEMDTLEVSESVFIGTRNIPHKDSTTKATFSYEIKSTIEDSMGNIHQRMVKKGNEVTDSVFRIRVDHWSDSTESFFNPKDSVVHLKAMANKILISLSGQDVDTEELSTFVIGEMDRRGLNPDFQVIRTMLGQDLDQVKSNYPLSVVNQSTYLPKGQSLKLSFSNSALAILRYSLVDFSISFLISAVVIGALIYLYRVIKNQKELSEIKDDLISNLTHEFKTPIATTMTALEGVSNFNESNDPVKTAKYIDISKDQLKKLDSMVEKLLMTATLESDQLEISHDKVEAISLTKRVFNDFEVKKGDKNLILDIPDGEIFCNADPFHFENVLSNLVDNALKYGGNEVRLSLVQEKDRLIWEVKDNGGNINRDEKERIFEKFYRIPRGNVHDVKGHGIGLYYVRQLTTLHGGQVELDTNKNFTLFRIILPI